MTRTIFLYSGEGTKSLQSSSKLVKTSPLWHEISAILEQRLHIDLETLWEKEIGSHRCPASPLLTVAAEICLSDIWTRWGYRPDIVVGHSVGELAAAYQAGMYSLEELLELTHEIGEAGASIDGRMLHGLLDEAQISDLEVSLSSRNFISDRKVHVTLSGSTEQMQDFLAAHHDFSEMVVAHPWHHPDYQEFVSCIRPHASRPARNALFVSGVTARFEENLAPDHWQRWLARSIDFIASLQEIRKRYPDDQFDIIEIGFHPVLKQCCDIFPAHTYASSMYRGEDEAAWILFQRRKLDQSRFIGEVTRTIESFRSGLDFDTPLSYQDFTSRTFVEFAALLRPWFPSLEPQDFYRYTSVRQLLDNFGDRPAKRKQAVRRPYQRNRVVISAMSCRFPASVQTLNDYWNTLLSGEDQVRGDAMRGDYEAGFLDPVVSRFDHHYFNIPDAEAKTMDPQQILALELTEMLFRDAGIDPASLDKSRVGVYLGAWNEEYRGRRDSVFYPTGTNPSIIASRISYHYDLRGPSLVINTACSSSLLAVHYGCKDIEAGRIDYAIAGGVNMLLGNRFTHSMRDSGFLSADQRCKTFDDSANGYVRAEGGGLVLLANRELTPSYYAEILGSSINQNGGRTQLITAPHPAAQEDLIAAACADAGVEPTDLNYIECHGTGTKIGDPIEISALQNSVAKNRTTPCHLGSVKSNMGHLESAAGVAGLIKSALALNRGVIPANIHFHTPNSFIDFDSFNLHVVDQPTPIDRTALIGVSSFGFGGANAHIVITGAGDNQRKPLADIASPFDRNRGVELHHYFSLDEEAQPPAIPDTAGSGSIRELVEKTFIELTGIDAVIPDVALTDQGLDSLSATDFVGTLQKKLGVDLDTDLLFDYPLVDALVDYLDKRAGRGDDGGDSAAPGNGGDRRDIAERVGSMVRELTNLTEIDPDIDLTDQGLDSLSATQLIGQLESQLQIELGIDVLFDHPRLDQLVDEICRCLEAKPV